MYVQCLKSSPAFSKQASKAKNLVHIRVIPPIELITHLIIFYRFGYVEVKTVKIVVIYSLWPQHKASKDLLTSNLFLAPISRNYFHGQNNKSQTIILSIS